MKLRILLWITLAASVITFGAYSYLKIPELTYGFAAYYSSSRMVLEGADYSKSYNFEYFNSKIKEYGFGDVQDMPNNLPTTSFVMLPLAWMSAQHAKIIWGMFSVLLFVLSIRILLKLFEIKLTGFTGLAFTSLCFLFYPAYRNIALGQIYILLLFLFTLSMYFIKQNKNKASSLAIALAFVFKGYGALVSLWLLARKKIKAFIAFTLFISIIFFISILVHGLDSWNAYINAVPQALLQNPASSVTAYQNIGGFFKHLFVFDKQWSPYPLIDLPAEAVLIFTGIITLIIIYLFIRKNYDIGDKTNLSLISYAAILGVSVITAPLAEEYHYVLFLPLIAGLAKILFYDIDSIKKIKPAHIVFIIAVIIMALPLDYKLLQNSHFPVYLLAYPKLYAGITLLMIFLIINKKSQTIITLKRAEE